MLSTNQVSIALPPDIVAVKVCDCHVVMAARRGERETVMPLGPGGGGVGGGGVGEVEELPPPQEISPGDNSAKANTPTGFDDPSAGAMKEIFQQHLQHPGLSCTVMFGAAPPSS
jgi:hypothetical protein